jgi:hypothetical protein
VELSSECSKAEALQVLATLLLLLLCCWVCHLVISEDDDEVGLAAGRQSLVGSSSHRLGHQGCKQQRNSSAHTSM